MFCLSLSNSFLSVLVATRQDRRLWAHRVLRRWAQQTSGLDADGGFKAQTAQTAWALDFFRAQVEHQPSSLRFAAKTSRSAAKDVLEMKRNCQNLRAKGIAAYECF